MIQKIRIATRKSPLALWQTHFIKGELLKHYPDLTVELIPLSTEGDEKLTTALYKIGGKGLFLKELEHALLNDIADIAVHSMKDVPVDLAKDFTVAAVCEREDPRDIVVSKANIHSLDDLKPGAIVGTSSLRRQSQLLALRPDLNIKFLRGNVGTRLAKLDNGDYDAIILAAAGIKRLGLEHHISYYLAANTFLPGIGQGAIGIECLTKNTHIQQLLKPLHHTISADCITAERAFSQRLDGGCHTPIGAYAEISNDQLTLHGLVGHPNGSVIIKETITGKPQQAESLGIDLAEKILAQGANEILATLS